MTHRVHPYIFRIGQTKGWKSRWFSRRKFPLYLWEDLALRHELEERLRQSHVEGIEIERFPRLLHVIVKAARPGLIIGRGGEGAEKLKQTIQRFLKKLERRFGDVEEKRELKLTIEEVRIPESYAAIAAQMVVDEIEKRVMFRRVLKRALDKVAAAKEVKGVKIALKGRLDGAEMARYEWAKRGRIPLQTLRADVDYAGKTAHTTYGTIGVKVWIYKGDIFENKVKS